MRAAAAALAGAVLFFLGTLAAGPGRDAGSPLRPIPLGTAPTEAGPSGPEADGRAPTGGETTPPDGQDGGPPAEPQPPDPSTTSPPAPPAEPGGDPQPGSDGDVEEVDNEVDCVEVGGGRGRAVGRDDACPPDGDDTPSRGSSEAPGPEGGRDDGTN